MNAKPKLTAQQLCLIALGAVINVIGAYIALTFRLPIYLDNVGTVLIAAIFGPLYAIIPPLISGIISAITTDIYALYFMPSAMIMGFCAGVIFRTSLIRKWKLPIGALVISLPAALVSACVSAFVFGGVTSAGSSIIVQFLSKIGANLVVSSFIIQIITEYADRCISISLVCAAMTVLVKNTTARYYREVTRSHKG